MKFPSFNSHILCNYKINRLRYRSPGRNISFSSSHIFELCDSPGSNVNNTNLETFGRTPVFSREIISTGSAVLSARWTDSQKNCLDTGPKLLLIMYDFKVVGFSIDLEGVNLSIPIMNI